MSFGYAVGDVIAVLGLFERVAVELRNYKGAPAHFQQLGAEIDLLRSTLRQVLALDPQDEAERRTIERVRAIAMHCMEPLQKMADKMQTKESSLGQFRTSKSLGHIGMRLHWSMVAQSDVDELRAILNSTSKILSIVSTTPKAIFELREVTVKQSEAFAAQTRALDEGLAIHALLEDARKLFSLLAACSREMLEAIGRNTLLLLDIARLMKRVVCAIEAIPLHITLDLLRLDDALGETWALPMQACRTWESFCEILQLVVYGNNRPGASRIAARRFVITMANTGSKLQIENWGRMIKPGMHIEQAMMVAGRPSEAEDKCPFRNCTGKMRKSADNNGGESCSTC
ncbi:hypothetical protein MN608_07439 [Microdochium nivale]|nr:hypothetical protein MN608_07439 [Microdochium nivale]